ncbi:MAG: sigma 54-interacting transcriptional regulator [Clostridiales Family XIII bacterium]|jgi:PAS domain S-box-containing protein|nr:sigma 54-interacting transcriptional regulator [Clostridiales Family XIII bacterium]
MRTVKGKKIKKISEKPAVDFDVLLDAMHDDVFITDGAGTVIEVSPTFEKTYGLAKEAAIGRSVRELEEEGYFKPSVTSIVLHTGEKTTISQKLKNGRDMVVTAAPIRDGDGRIIRVVSFSRDVTEFLLLKEQYSEMESRMARYREELDELRRNATETDGILAYDERTVSLLKTLRRVAPFDANVLLSGESGVGKSLFAKYIHSKSGRAKGPFIEINCGAIPGRLLESELFGYEKGSFTGADRVGKLGRVELAQNGTLFLDEIGELPPDLQVKLLKVIQDKCILRVGGIREIKVDFRLIAATNKNLALRMDAGDFREDLYYRLHVIALTVPPLRERRDDIVPLAAHFVKQFNRRYGMKKQLSKDVYRALAAYSWPGNVRELENLIERLMITAENDRIAAAELPDALRASEEARSPAARREDEGGLSLAEALERLEARCVRDAYAAAGNTVGAAKLLGISQPTAFRKIRKYVKGCE